MTINCRERHLTGFVEELSSGDVADERIADVADALAASGARLPDQGLHSATFASTGGPTSLSTLLVPLYLRAAGLCVPTLAVPGRPAGGVDVLATLPGYRTELDADEVERVLYQSGHAHLAAGRTWAPDDADLFVLRQRMGAQARPALVIASVIAKTLAVGVRRVGLDVRVAPYGNFGATVGEAEVNARWFERVARIVGLDATCLLTDGTRAYQPYIGRGEALMAISEVLNGRAIDSLAAHAELCRRMASEVAETSGAVNPVSLEVARYALRANLDAQGAAPDAIDLRVADLRARDRIDVFAQYDGLASFSLDQMRDAVVAHQHDTGLADGAGVILRQETGAPVIRGDLVLTLRCQGPTDSRARLAAAVNKAAAVVDDGVPAPFEPVVIRGRVRARLLGVE